MTDGLRRLHRWLWWWHFWPGILLAPVILLASLTGALYVWKQEGESLLYDRFTSVPPASGRVTFDRMIGSAKEEVPGDLFSLDWSGEAGDAAEVYVREEATGRTVLLWVNPHTSVVTGWRYRDEMLFTLVRDLHRWIWSGRLLNNVLPGRLLVEAATSWAVLLTFSGLALWWNGSRKRPRQWRLLQRNRPYILWRNWHSVPAVWMSGFLVLILISGLVFSKGAGTLWKGAGVATNSFPESYINHPETETAIPWVSFEELIRGSEKPGDPEHLSLIAYGEASRVPLVLRGNYQTEPWKLQARWLEPQTGAIISETSWAAMHPYAKAHIAAYSVHVGWIGGLWTKVLATLLCLLLVFLVISGLVMWWIRRPRGNTGFPRKSSPKLSLPFLLLITSMAVIFPLVGLSLLFYFTGLAGFFLFRYFFPRFSPPE